ncbi:hypothetical protein GCM10011505_06630 [Tistrella bauzanensis]|uniref:FAD-binding PCMH-type domain-containing protein n=1 Tax=Tistrella bauzanensis TaxID=657419 RepID=A0ABQ1I8R2_9PROT|nr:hypothetical protein GCM10011505_06630 [Tistrella bauzanensis]
MQPFQLEPATTGRGPDARPPAAPTGADRGQFIAGGTNLVDLMHLGVATPGRLLDLDAAEDAADDPAHARRGITRPRPDMLRLGALTRMAEAAADPLLRRRLPMLAQTLELAASPQIRNMASLGGNILQRTRCMYFRDTSWPCNKRAPGSGCAAIDGCSRQLAILGTSRHCIASYPGDFAQGLMAMDAVLDIVGSDGRRRPLPIADLHLLPGDRPDVETTLAPGEMITAIEIPAPAWAARSVFVKLRDRASFAFALVSVACALDLDATGHVREVRLALGGVATVPWRLPASEALLKGEVLTEDAANAAAVAAFTGAALRPDNAFKRDLGIAAITRALLAARDLPPPSDVPHPSGRPATSDEARS